MCDKCDRKVIHETTDKMYKIQCGGCHKPIYGDPEKDCEQFILSPVRGNK